MAWNRKYRPSSISGLHLVEVRNQLETLILQGSIPQALLFAGPKGTGKTSAARILGALLNDPENLEPVKSIFFSKKKTKKGSSLQDIKTITPLAEKILSGDSYVVQEMDAASNRGIDDIRALKERIMLPPQEGVITVYILDEAHMLTTEAFNALLKLLEEPPEHVLFVLATTALHKIPATISSRCHVVQFRQATNEEILAALKSILEKEKIAYDTEALGEIAHQSDGSFRDAIKLLELAASTGKVTLESVEKFSGIQIIHDVEELITAVIAKDSPAVSAIFSKLRQRNVDSKHFHRQVAAYLHQQLLKSFQLVEGKPTFKETAARFLLSEISSLDLSLPSPLPHLPLELKFLEIIERAKKNGPNKGGVEKSHNNSPKKSNNNANFSNKAKVIAEDMGVTSLKSSRKFPPIDQGEPDTLRQPTHHRPGDGKALINNWEHFIDLVNQENSTFAALLRSAEPVSGDTGEIKLRVYYKFHAEQLAHSRFMELAARHMETLCNGQVAIDIILTEPRTDKVQNAPDSSGLNEDLAQVASETLM